MEQAFDDISLSRHVRRLEADIRKWATRHHIWSGCGFKTYREHVKGEPGQVPVVSILYFDSPFADFVPYGRLDEEFADLVESHGFYYENAGYCNIYFYPDDGPRCEAYSNYYKWEWICSLVQPDFSDIYEELYGHFACRPGDLQRLSWREFEILLARIFQAQGFTTELGPGRGDGGVDIRLLQRDPIGDILTLVQAKKYAPKNRIGLEAVAALSGIAGVEKAQQSLFITTSSYQPAAEKFAARTSGALKLCTSADVAEWCRSARDGIIKDKSTLVEPSSVERILLNVQAGISPCIVHAHCGYSIIDNKFALILKETKHAALLMELPKQTVSDDGYGQRGSEIPLLDPHALTMLKEDTVWRAMRSVNNDGKIHYWDGRNLFSQWDGKPAHFDLCD